MGLILLILVTVIIGATVTVFAFQLGENVSDVGPVAEMRFESTCFGDVASLNDSVTITHAGGDRLRRGRLEVYVGDNHVFNESDNSESNGGQAVPGLLVEVDADQFNDLNKACRFKPSDCTPSDPPGDSDGAARA